MAVRAARRILLVAAAVLVVSFCCAPAASAAPKRTIILVVDVSGSMDSDGRLPQAQAALRSTIGSLDKNDVVGLHTFAGFSCDDGGQLVVPPGTGNRDELRSEVDNLIASGETPTPAAIRQAVSEFPDDSSEKILMLVSDGESSCGDPCDVVTEVEQQTGVEFVAHTVGFRTDDSAEEQLRCIADRTGGKYFSAENEEAIADSLKAALTTPVNKDVSTVLHSLPTPGDVPLDGKSVGISAALGAAFVLLVGFPSELFNRTLEANHDRISRSRRRRGGPGAGPAGGGGPAPGGGGGGGPYPPDGPGGGPGDPGAAGGTGADAASGQHAQHGQQAGPMSGQHAGAPPAGSPGPGGGPGGGGLGLHGDYASGQGPQGGVQSGFGGGAAAGGPGYGTGGGTLPSAAGGAPAPGAAGGPGFAGATGGVGIPGATGGVGAVGATGGMGATGGVGALGAAGGVGNVGAAGGAGATGAAGGVGVAGVAGGARSLWASPWILPIFVLVSALASTFVDPDAGFTTRSGILLLGFVVAVPLVLFAYAWPNEQVARRASHVPAALRTVPAALGLAVFCTVLSRVSQFVPGYVFGLVLGYVALRERRLTRAQEGKGVLLGALTALLVSVAAWVGLEFVHDKALEPGASVGLTIADSVLGTTFILGVETVIFGLVPLSVLDGNKLRKWNAWIWAGTYAVAILLFVHVLLLNSDAAGSDNDTSVTAAVILFAVFGLLSLGFWAYFKYVPDPALVRRPALAGVPTGYPTPPRAAPVPPPPVQAPPVQAPTTTHTVAAPPPPASPVPPPPASPMPPPPQGTPVPPTPSSPPVRGTPVPPPPSAPPPQGTPVPPVPPGPPPPRPAHTPPDLPPPPAHRPYVPPPTRPPVPPAPAAPPPPSAPPNPPPPPPGSPDKAS
ncbi:FGLLP motif-containing membrane protein [Yinghuangia sp. ASG 101]|uniref:FGLLP motif-containing membrane protein n=1 Tax=Yinghuangia sp. ASG 101 TaxID=2896848 RepID=UPI0022B24179|nr:FGLLP motif-containing membrane protein [Yinghuangia sp. ASG 101]